MRIQPLIYIFLLITTSWMQVASESVPEDNSTYKAAYAEASEIYQSLTTDTSLPTFDVFFNGYAGYVKLKEQNQLQKKPFLTLIDFTLSANEPRLWVIDLEKRNILFHELVAHGMRTGEEYARVFSNKPGSHQSSIGFYRTAEPYHGKHGLSLRLDGLEPGINDKARERAIVMHGASYVNNDFIRQNGRLGRSHGCPAVSATINKSIINTIKEGSCLFIFYPDAGYYANSKLAPVNEEIFAGETNKDENVYSSRISQGTW